MLRLLIIDDESAIRSGIAAYFPWSSLGIEVAATCKDGQEALAVMETMQFDLVLSDIRMPHMDGIQFAQKVRERRYPCDIVFISAHKDFEYAKKAIELGVKEYIVKPAGFEELYEVFSKIANERSAAAGNSAFGGAFGGAGAQADGAAGSAPATSGQGAGPEAVAPHGAPGAGAGSPGQNPTASLAERLARILERDLASTTLVTAAEALGMSPNYLSAKLHQETGKTFSEILLDARMRRARALVMDPAARVGHISRMVGYANTKSFIRAFRLYFGASPTTFRGIAPFGATPVGATPQGAGPGTAAPGNDGSTP